jgi:hypothetical protein
MSRTFRERLMVSVVRVLAAVSVIFPLMTIVLDVGLNPVGIDFPLFGGK